MMDQSIRFRAWEKSNLEIIYEKWKEYMNNTYGFTISWDKVIYNDLWSSLVDKYFANPNVFLTPLDVNFIF